ncbi:MAG: MTAP family purine nucleoside phosphorylase [Acidimicrobiia bacterium]
MTRLGVVGGHSILGSGYGSALPHRQIAIDGADAVTLLESDEHVVLHRHGVDSYTPAHLVNHVANLRALAEAGCERVLAISSVGGLRTELAVGTFVAPDDFIALDTSIAVHHDARSHLVPHFDQEWRSNILRAASDAGTPVRDGGVYWQSTGPRFETRAEVRFIARFADVVGMTAASEAIVAQELGLSYAVVCVVDNLANGIAEQPLTTDEFEAGKRATRTSVLALLDAIVPVLAG